MLGGEFPAIDPVLIDLPGPFDVRYYGLMYVVAFVVAQVVLTRLAKARFFPVPPDAVGDFVFYLVLGVILGGRFGYALFYDQDLLHPTRIFEVWRGGLAFHGGLIGVIVAAFLFARKHRITLPWLRAADSCALAVTPGIFAVRMANFINGELFGRPTTADTFGAMQFPTDRGAMRAMGLDRLDDKRLQELGIQVACGKREWADVAERFPHEDAAGRAIPWPQLLDWERVRALKGADGELLVPFRHPSQLYEGAGEGILVGLVLLATYLVTRRRPLGLGAYAGLFLIGYGAVRFGIERLRQPDAQFITAENPGGTVLFGMTMGQTLCSVMILCGLGFLAYARSHRPPLPDAPVGGAGDGSADAASASTPVGGAS